MTANKHAYSVKYAPTGEPFSERLFATHAAASAFAQKKMMEPGWRVAGWPRKVEAAAIAKATGGEE